MWPSYNFCVTLFFLKLFHVTFIWPSCDFCKTLVCYDSKASQSHVIWPRGFYFLSFFSRINRFWPVTKKNISKAWDALKAEDTYTAFHFWMETSVGTLFFSASLFCCQEKPASCPAVKCPQPPHPVERTLHVSFCPFFVAGTGRTISLATPNFRLFTLYRKFGGLRWLLIRAMS